MEKGRKYILILLVALLCFVTVGCGSSSSEGGSGSSSKKKGNVSTLTCTIEEEDTGKMEVVISQNKKTYELTEGTMKVSMDVSEYIDDYDYTEKDFEEMFCEDEDVYESCIVKINKGNLTVDMKIDMDAFLEELDADEKPDKDTLNDIKEEMEDGGYTCKIS